MSISLSAPARGSRRRVRRAAAFATVTALATVGLGALAAPARAAFPGGNGPIYVLQFASGSSAAAWSVRPDGTGPVQLTDGTQVNDGAAANPANMKIAYGEFTSAAGGNHLYTANPDGTGVTDITPAGVRLDGGTVGWSPDGTKIAFGAAVPGGLGNLMTINADGSGATSLNVSGADPAFSPGGTKIAYDDGANIWVANADGSGATKLTGFDGANADGVRPSWSPDGTKIAFNWLDNSGEVPINQVYAMNADGTGQTNLSNDQATASESDPIWSPDGTKIAYSGGDNALWTMNPDGTGKTQLYAPTGVVVLPSDWAPAPAAPAPMVNSFSPVGGPTTGGTTVTIAGSGFTGATAVDFGSVPATSFTVESDSLISAVTPAQPAGGVSVSVTTPGGTGTSLRRYTYAEDVTIAGPPSATVGTGYAYTVTDTNAGGAPGEANTLIASLSGAAATFTGGSIAGDSVDTCTPSGTQITCAYQSDNLSGNDATITLSVLPTAAGTVGVSTVVTGSSPGHAATSTPITQPTPAPAVTGLSPTHGSVAGGTSVTITGTGFTGATGVHFGTAAATSFTVNSDTSITATTPAHGAGAVDVTVTTPGGTSTSTTGAADQYTYVNTVAQIQGAGRIPVAGHAGEFGVAAQRTSAGGAVSGHLEFEDQPDNVHLHDGTFTDLYVTADGTAHAQGSANCTISGVTSTCLFSLTATDGGKGAGSFTLTYNTTTVGGTILSGHVTVTASTGGSGPSAATPAVAATIGSFSTTLLGVSLTGGQCAVGAEVTSSGSAGGEVDCLLIGVLGINIEVSLPSTTGTTAAGTATLGGSATVTIGGALPLSLPATATLLSTGSTPGLQLTIAGVTLPVLPIGAGGLEIG